MSEALKSSPPEQISLPGDYSYADPTEVLSQELADLFATEPGWRLTRRDRTLYWGGRGVGVIDVAVRAGDQALVGFSSILRKGSSGELSDFIVHPEHRHQGIGKALIAERLRLAKEKGIDSLYIPGLADTNSLRTFYEEYGFRETPAGELTRGSDPFSVSGTSA